MARSAAGRANRAGVTWDPRSGMKVRGNKLREDGERRHLFTTDPDQYNPQRLVRNPGPDGKHFRPGIAPPHAAGARVSAGLNITEDLQVGAPVTMALTGGNGTIRWYNSTWNGGTWGSGTWGGRNTTETS